MNRVEVAINEGRCVLLFGGRALADAETLGELRRRSGIPAAVLSGDAPSPATRLDEFALAPALSREGGVICLVDAESADSVGLSQLATYVQNAAHKPRLVVAARAFSPFGLPPALRTLKFDHEKSKPRDFLFKLPVPAAAAAPAAAAPAPEKKKSGAPKISFAGREEELAWMAERTAGPVVVAGPLGIGKRWLVERALMGSTNRVPDFFIGRGSEADALFGRIAFHGREANDHRLAEALVKPDSRPAPAALAALAVDTLDKLDITWVIDGLDRVMRADGTFHRESRLELLLRAMLFGSYKARVVFTTTIAPRSYREGEGINLPILPLAGLKGKELHQIFEAYRVEDFPREHFGRISDRIHGHPLAARLFAVAVRDPEAREEFLESAKFFAMENAGDIEAIKRRVQKSVESLTDDERKDLALLAHFRMPFTAADCELTGVKRENRLVLLAKGLLEMVPDETRERTFYVHRLVDLTLPRRETSLYDLLEALGNQYIQASHKEKGSKAYVLALEGNRFLFESHRTRERSRMPFPDHDPALESLRGLIRGRQPRFDLAEQRLAECLKTDPANTELLLMKAELMAEAKVKGEEIAAVFAEAATRAPTPEVFHLECNFAERRGGNRNRAIAALEKGTAAFPESGRMKRRLAGHLLGAGRYDAAVTVLKEAMALEPMMPDTYGLLGEVYLTMGADHWGAAAEALAEARRLDPENTLHMARLGALLVETAGNDEAKLDEAQKVLEATVQADKKNFPAHLFLGRLLIDREGDLDRADWLLRGANKINDSAVGPVIERARIAARKGFYPEAEALLERTQKADPKNWHTFFARGELFERQGHVFNAGAEYQKALELAPEAAGGRFRVEAALGRMQALITSGAAIEMVKAAEAAAAAKPAPAGSGPKRNPGNTTKRRRKGGGGEASAVAEGSGGGEAGAAVEGSSAEGSSAEGDSAPGEASAERGGEAEGGGASGTAGTAEDFQMAPAAQAAGGAAEEASGEAASEFSAAGENDGADSFGGGEGA